MTLQCDPSCLCAHRGSGQGNISSRCVEAAFGSSLLPPVVDITETSRSLETPVYRIEEYQAALPLDYILLV